MAAASAHRANETAERFSVVYSVHGKDEADARERTTALCLEQTVELPAKLVQDDPFLWNEVVGQLEHFQVPAPPPIRRSSAADDERRPVHADNRSPSAACGPWACVVVVGGSGRRGATRVVRTRAAGRGATSTGD